MKTKIFCDIADYKTIKFFNNKKIVEVNTINLIAGKGVIGDRHFKEYNDPYNHLSIIESENIDEYLSLIHI